MTKRLPEQLSKAPLIKLRPESKAPVVDSYALEPLPAIRDWLRQGGNVGVACLKEWVAIDIDSEELGAVVEEHLPATFTVKTGSGGRHKYYKCDDWGEGKSREFGGDVGSIRSDGKYVVAPPSIHPDTGDRYTVQVPVPVTEIEADVLEDVVSELTDTPTVGTPSQHQGRRRAGVDCIPASYPSIEAEWSTVKKWLQSNGFLHDLERSASADWSGLEFKLCKCLAEAGYSVDTIKDTLNRMHPNAKWHDGGAVSVERYRDLTVTKAIETAAFDPWDYWTDDGDRSSAPKLEEKKRDNAPAWWLERHAEPGGETDD